MEEAVSAGLEETLFEKSPATFWEVLRVLVHYDRLLQIDHLSIQRSDDPDLMTSKHYRHPGYPPPGYDFGDLFVGHAERLFGQQAEERAYSITIVKKKIPQGYEGKPDYLYATVVALDTPTGGAAGRSTAGLEEDWLPRMERERFLQLHPEQAGRVPPAATHLLVIPEGKRVVLYRPETLRQEVEDLLAEQRKELPVPLRVEPAEIPTDPLQVRSPSLFLLDELLDPPDYLAGLRAPVIKHSKGQPLAYNLLQMIALAMAANLQATSVKLLAAWPLEEGGRSYTVLAVQA